MRLIAVKASRTLALTAALAVSAALASGCTAASTTGSTTGDATVGTAHRSAAANDRAVRTASFSGLGLTFDYPARWQSGTWNDITPMGELVVALSTSRLRNPCTTTAGGAGSCGYPVKALPPGGVLVSWSAYSNPVWHLPKANTVVGGRKAAETRTSGGWCATLRGTEAITVMIPRTGAGNWYQMDACLRAPGLSQLEAEVSAMLASVRISDND
jgi:hypothetical protein